VYQNAGNVSEDRKNTAHCDYNSPPGDKVCSVDPKEWGSCSSENSYNYPKSAPCIFLKLNKVSHKSFLKQLLTSPRNGCYKRNAGCLKFFDNYITREPNNEIWALCLSHILIFMAIDGFHET
jgi:hypothetical protein